MSKVPFDVGKKATHIKKKRQESVADVTEFEKTRGKHIHEKNKKILISDHDDHHPGFVIRYI